MEFTGERFVPTELGAIRQEHMHRYAWCVGLMAGKDVLDVASGEGYGSAMLAAGRARSVIGVDVSDDAVAHANGEYGSIGNLRFVAGSAANLPLADASVDIVVSFETIEHLEQQKEMLAELRRVLRPDGFLIISSPNKRVYSDQAGYRNEFHVKELYFEEFDDLLRQEFPAVRYLGHRLAVGSTIAPLRTDESADAFLAFTDTGARIEPRSPAFADPMYYIGIAAASQSALPRVSPSVLYSEAEDLYEHHREVARWAHNQNAEIARVNDAVESQRARAEEMTHWAQTLDSKLAELEARHQKLQADHAEVGQWAEQLRAELAESRANGEQLRGELAESRADGEQLRGELTESRANGEQLRGELAESRADRERQEQLLRELNDRLESTSAHARDLMRQLKEAHARMQELKERLMEADAQMQTLTKEVHSKEEHVARLRSELDDRVAAYELRIEQIEVTAATRSAELMEEIGTLQRQMQDIVRSRSWRLTRPLRFLARVMHGDWPAVIESLRASRLAHHAWLKPLRSPAKRWLMRRVQPAPVFQHRVVADTPVASDALSGLAFPVIDDPVVSVIIPAYGNLPYTLACLKSLAANPSAVTCEVLVVEDASGDDAILELANVPGLRFHRNEHNLGFLRSCNHSAGLARGRYLCFLNNDTEVMPGWLDSLVDVFDKMPDAGMAGARLVYPDGRQQEAGGIVWADGTAWNFGRLQDPREPEFNYIKEADYVSGAAILLPTALFRQLGGFDEYYVPAYCEDTDLAFRVRQAGLKVYYQPNARVIHHEGISHGTDTNQGIKAYQVQNQEKMRARWHSTLSTEHFDNAECVFLAKDRSQLKKTILVIDHYVPQPDRDAGSRTMWQFMRLFRKHGMSVKFWPENLWYDPHYAPLLQQEGVEVIYGAGFVGRFEDWIRENGRAIDYVLLSRPHVSTVFLKALKKHTPATILYYGHDVHHLRLRDQLTLEHSPELEQQLLQFQAQEPEVWEQVDAIYYPSSTETSYVNGWLAQAGHAEKSRTIPVYAFDTFPDEPWKNAAARLDLLFVAGFAHAPNVDAAIWFVNDVFPLIRKRHPGIKLYLVGSNPTEGVRELEGGGVHVTGFVSDEALAGYYRTSKVAVAPLRYGGGMKGKVVEAMRFGIPCVTTPAGAQGFSGTSEFLSVAEDAASFATAVLRLLDDEEAWLRASRLSQAFARERFSEDALWEVVAEHIDAQPYPSVAARRAVLHRA